MFLVIYFKWLC